jgi:hypothetical protein
LRGLPRVGTHQISQVLPDRVMRPELERQRRRRGRQELGGRRYTSDLKCKVAYAMGRADERPRHYETAEDLDHARNANCERDVWKALDRVPWPDFRSMVE